MAFLGFEAESLDKEKQYFVHTIAQGAEEVPVFTWGEESYDGLGDALQEGGDELNDETFGNVDAVGKDFDFSSNTLPKFEHTPDEEASSSQITLEQVSLDFRPLDHFEAATSGHDQSPYASVRKAESIWGDKSPFFILPHANGDFNRVQDQHIVSSPPVSDARATLLLSKQLHEPSGHQAGLHTLEEIEAEMRAATQAKQKELFQQQMQVEEEERQRMLQDQELQHQILYQQEQHQLHMQRLLQQQREQQYQRTPPPRMLPTSQSPRFLEHQRQLFLLQQQQQQEQQLQQQRMQDQIKLDEMERQLLARAAMQQQRHQSPNPAVWRHRPSSGLSLNDTHRQQGSQFPASGNHRYDAGSQDNLVLHTPHNIQLQQRLLSEMAQAEFIRNTQGSNTHAVVEHEALRMEAMRKILETEQMEEKRRRKAAKIAHMSRYNDLMTQSDKDFITRIQVSQLVTQDPYADDFYAQVYGAILRSKMGLQSQDERNTALQSLQGALGKTSGRSYKAAPRQLLQVNSGAPPVTVTEHVHVSKEAGSRSKGAEEAAKLGREALGNAADTTNLVRREPLTQREILMILENIYDLILHVEQLGRNQSPTEDDQSKANQQKQYSSLVDEIWDALRVMVPLETSDPHPFISLLIPTKGKKVLSRIARHLNDQRMLTMLTLLVACFNQLDVVKQALVLDHAQESKELSEAERQTQSFLTSVLQSILPIVAKANLRLVTGLLGLLVDRSNVVIVAQTRPGLALLTLFLSRVEVIKQNMNTIGDTSELPSPDEAQQWQLVFDHLFQLVAPHLLLLFPSTRTTASGLAQNDVVDQPVWQFLAAVALHAASDQQHILVTALRDKILDNVVSVNKGWIRDEEERQTKLANINLFLHALGLDSSQIIM
ncbi:hypothetical protein APHAL10511_004459 [Amanita phalloides]|nr:hypothetical protein APHAL10511_004459 [Amanita phalloides]